MKKTTLSILVALAATGSIASSVNAAEILKTDTATVDFYGQLREQLYQADKNSSSTLSSGSSRAGVNASYVVSNDLTVLGTVEFGIGQSNTGTNRYHFVGVSSKKWGQLTLGKQETLNDEIWGAENSYFGNAISELPEDVFGFDWTQDAMLRYQLEGDAGWVKAAYSYHNGNKNPTTAEVFAGTTLGNFDLYGGVGYMEDKTSTTTTATVRDTDGQSHTITTTDTASTSDSELLHGMVTLNYNGQGWNVGATYWHADFDDNADSTNDLTTDSLVVAGAYDLTKAWSVYGGYEEVFDYKQDDNDYNNVYGGVLYKYGSLAKFYAETGFSNDDISESDSYYGVGVRVYW